MVFSQNNNGQLKINLRTVITIMAGGLSLAVVYFGGILTTERLMNVRIASAQEKSDDKAESVRQEALTEIKAVRTESLAAIKASNDIMRAINQRMSKMEGALDAIQRNSGG